MHFERGNGELHKAIAAAVPSVRYHGNSCLWFCVFDYGIRALRPFARDRWDSRIMSLYLVILNEDEELDGFQVGSYSDFGKFRDSVVKQLERGGRGSRYPTLMLHSDCDGEWTPSQAALLEKELEDISEGLRKLPPTPLAGWQKEVAEECDLQMNTLYDCFFDVNGDPLLERLIDLARLSQKEHLPILFQ